MKRKFLSLLFFLCCLTSNIEEINHLPEFWPHQIIFFEDGSHKATNHYYNDIEVEKTAGTVK